MAEAKTTKANQKAEMGKKRKHCPVQDIDLFSYDNQIELTFSHSTKAAKAPIFDLDSSDDDDDDDCVEDYEEFKRTNDYEDDDDDLLEDSLEIQITDSEESMAERSIDRSYKRSPSPPPPPPSQAELLRVQQQLRARKGARDFENAFSSLKQAVADNFLSPISQTRQQPTGVIQLDDMGSPFNVRDSADRFRNIKVRTTSGIRKFKIKAGDKFEVIIKELAKLQGVAVDNILLSLNNVNILPDDTPLTNGVTVADIVECVTMESCADVDEDNFIEIKIQGGDAASKKTFNVHKNKPLEQLFKDYAKYRKLPKSKLKFLFDGDALTGDETPEQLDMEDENVIDVTSRK